LSKTIKRKLPEGNKIGKFHMKSKVKLWMMEKDKELKAVLIQKVGKRYLHHKE